MFQNQAVIITFAGPAFKKHCLDWFALYYVKILDQNPTVQ